jgi:hypothetical protein
MVAKGLDDLTLTNPRLTEPLRVLLALPIPRKVKSVIFSVPTTPQGQILLNLVRHVLELRELETGTTIDLQRLKWRAIDRHGLLPLSADRLTRVQIEPSPPHRRRLERFGVALLLFPPLLAQLFEQANRAHGRASAASIRNCLSRVHFVVAALCRWVKCGFFLSVHPPI